ncbi:MAG: hypothetical protein IJ343_05995 [Clostridia bacterium]|nr:hypothetical protein [Clostridia bacterium]
MNEKLKQSLEGRLSGMRWSEGEQAELFRQIQRKEMHDVKHVRRGTGMLLVIVTVLFFVMGAAYAVTRITPPEETVRLSQPDSGDPIPLPAAQYENEYIILTIDSASWDGANAAFGASIRLKEPERYALSVGGYSNPGSAEREVLTLTLNAECITQVTPTHASGTLITLVELLDMSKEHAVVRMSSDQAHADGEEIRFTLTLGAQGTETAFSATVDFIIPRSDSGTAASARQLLFSNSLVTGYLKTAYHTEAFTVVDIELEPSKPWYGINTAAPDKSNLLVGISDMTACAAGSAAVLTSAPMTISAQNGATVATALLTYEKAPEHVTLQCGITAADPVTGSTVTQPVTLNVSVREIQTAASATPPPAAASSEPQPTARPEPDGEYVGGNDVVSAYLEDCWFDGFIAEATLRIRSDDPSALLAVRPNEKGVPDRNTWVVQLDCEWNDDYQTLVSLAPSVEEATGDVIIRLVYEDLHSSFRQPDNGTLLTTLPLILDVTNELTWERHSDRLNLHLRAADEYEIQPLYLIEGDGEDVFVQGSLLTTDRYHYIGVMIDYSNQYLPSALLLDDAGTELASGSYVSVNGQSLLSFPRRLFPYEGDASRQYNLLVMRLDTTCELPEVLPVKLMQSSKSGTTELATLRLSPVPQTMAERTILDGDYASVVLTNASSGEGWTTGRLRIDLKDPRAHTLVNYGPQHPAEFLDVSVKLTAMNSTAEGGLRSLRAFKLLSTDGSHSNRQEYFFTGDTAEWAASDARTVLAEMSVRDADGVTLETQTVTLALPRRGGVTRYRLVSTEDTPMENLEYHGGTLLVSPDACYAEMTYRCTGNCTQAGFFPYIGGEALVYRLKYTDAYPAEKNPVKITQLWWEPDGPVPETIDFIVEDANNSPHPEIARFTVRVEPISE